MTRTVLAVCGITILCATLGAAEKKLTMSQLPAAVQKTVQEQTKGAEVLGFSKEVENGKTLYEVETKVDGKTKDYMIDPKGNVVETEDEVSLDSIPEAAKAGLLKAAGSGKIDKVELLKQGDSVKYEAAIHKGAKKSEVLVTAAGVPTKD